MSKAVDLMKKIEKMGEVSYLGQHNDYSTRPYDTDAAEYLRPFSDLQLPDKPDKPGMPDAQQTLLMARKSRGEDGIASPNN